MSKTRVALLFGGKSAEHEVSLQSAKNVFESIDRNKYDVLLIGIDHDGKWHLNDAERFLIDENDPGHIRLDPGKGSLALVPGESEQKLVDLNQPDLIGGIDVVFPILHGPLGEDGTVQGLLRLADIPFVGSGVLGSAISMDKVIMKRLFEQAGIPHARFMSCRFENRHGLNYDQIPETLGTPFFIKPANMGSSVGINKVHNPEEFERAVSDAFLYDNLIIIEENIEAREIECSVLGNEKPIVSVTGEVLPSHEFYDYDAKYIDDKGASFDIPARLPVDVAKEIQNLALQSFQILNCNGMARVDFFVTADEKIYVNELNTIPGFTRISMYPKLWEASGISYTELIDRLIQLALEKYTRENRLRHRVQP
jgi:D-alanine-D-alanine ligase